ncbi:hypothetical protein [Arthrobacter sp. FW306-07-I]|uniref:hypothetical protein n=1 Tax=Arthrobacter sp. FW306-07-I TaxID=2879622 RepID=UPI001F2D7392|nr:hypothetical protein [Arthrobacter sp. FW306-07-I]MDP9985315.1 hypothetical protein [Arthrobacter oryzae]UKA74990.1 hypothetical protein LFT46_17885 [Arthrobacter sp. FW306-07-I]
MTILTVQRPAPPLTLFWKLTITLAAIVGTGTCVVLGFIYVHFFVGVPGTVEVLERQLTKQDAVHAIQDDEGDAEIRESRFLASYESTSYYAAPGIDPGVACLVVTSPWDDERSYWEMCHEVRDGRDVLVGIQDPDSRDVLFVPDQFDHAPLERDGWMTLHRNLLIRPLAEVPQPAEPPTSSAVQQETGQGHAILI